MIVLTISIPAGDTAFHPVHHQRLRQPQLQPQRRRQHRPAPAARCMAEAPSKQPTARPTLGSAPQRKKRQSQSKRQSQTQSQTQSKRPVFLSRSGPWHRLRNKKVFLADCDWQSRHAFRHSQSGETEDSLYRHLHGQWQSRKAGQLFHLTADRLLCRQ